LQMEKLLALVAKTTKFSSIQGPNHNIE
jgi:hypothetical protein